MPSVRFIVYMWWVKESCPRPVFVLQGFNQNVTMNIPDLFIWEFARGLILCAWHAPLAENTTTLKNTGVSSYINKKKKSLSLN